VRVPRVAVPMLVTMLVPMLVPMRVAVRVAVLVFVTVRVAMSMLMAVVAVAVSVAVVMGVADGMLVLMRVWVLMSVGMNHAVRVRMPAKKPMGMAVSVRLRVCARTQHLPARPKQAGADHDDQQTADNRQPGIDSFHLNVLRGVKRDEPQHEDRSSVRNGHHRAQVHGVPDRAARSGQISRHQRLAMAGSERMSRAGQKSDAQGCREKPGRWIGNAQQRLEGLADGGVPVCLPGGQSLREEREEDEVRRAPQKNEHRSHRQSSFYPRGQQPCWGNAVQQRVGPVGEGSCLPVPGPPGRREASPEFAVKALKIANSSKRDAGPLTHGLLR